MCCNLKLKTLPFHLFKKKKTLHHIPCAQNLQNVRDRRNFPLRAIKRAAKTTDKTTAVILAGIHRCEDESTSSDPGRPYAAARRDPTAGDQSNRAHLGLVRAL